MAYICSTLEVFHPLQLHLQQIKSQVPPIMHAWGIQVLEFLLSCQAIYLISIKIQHFVTVVL